MWNSGDHKIYVLKKIRLDPSYKIVITVPGHYPKEFASHL